MLSSLLYHKDIMKAIYARLYVTVSKELLMPQKVSWLLNLNISLKGDIKTRVTSQNKCHRIKDGQVVLLRGVYLIPTQKHPILTVSCSKGRLQQNPFPLLCITMNEQYNTVYQKSMMRELKHNSSSE